MIYLFLPKLTKKFYLRDRKWNYYDLDSLIAINGNIEAKSNDWYLRKL